MRFNPRIGYSRFEGGRTELRGNERDLCDLRTCVPVVDIEGLQLREVAVERGYILRTDAPECTNFQNITWDRNNEQSSIRVRCDPYEP